MELAAWPQVSLCPFSGSSPAHSSEICPSVEPSPCADSDGMPCPLQDRACPGVLLRTLVAEGLALGAKGSFWTQGPVPC